MIEDEQIFTIRNWVTQRNTRGIGSSKNYMSAREDFYFLQKLKIILLMCLILLKNLYEKI